MCCFLVCSLLISQQAANDKHYAIFLLLCPLKFLVGANSPSLCPTINSVTYTGMNLLPLCTANVCPTKSGVIVDLRDHVFITPFLFFPSLIPKTLVSSFAST